MRVSSAKLAVEHRLRRWTYGATYEAVDVEARRTIQAITPNVGVQLRGIELGIAYRFVVSERSDPMALAFPQSRFSATLDQRF